MRASWFAAIFRRDDMRPQKGGDNFEGLLGVEFLVQGENAQFGGDIEAVAAFGFDGGGAVFGESLEEDAGTGFELIGGGGAQLFDGIEDAAALAGDFFVTGALNLEFVLFEIGRASC